MKKPKNQTTSSDTTIYETFEEMMEDREEKNELDWTQDEDPQDESR